MIKKEMPLLMDQSKSGRKAIKVPEAGVKKSELPDSKFLRTELSLPEVGQLDLIRYFTNLLDKISSLVLNYLLPTC
mgnify:CR=1 FL=1